MPRAGSFDTGLRLSLIGRPCLSLTSPFVAWPKKPLSGFIELINELDGDAGPEDGADAEPSTGPSGNDEAEPEEDGKPTLAGRTAAPARL